MRVPFLSRLFMTSPFDELQEHAEKVKECVWAFQQAIECYAAERCKVFDDYLSEVDRLESEADAIKRRIRGHLPVNSRLPVSKFQLFLYLREQDKVLDSVEKTLDWISYRMEPGIPKDMEKDFFLLVDSVIEPIEDLSRMVAEAKNYFETYSNKQRNLVKDIIHNLRKREHEADRLEADLKKRIFSIKDDPTGTFHLVRLAELIGSIADHAENAGDMMRAMIARKKSYFF
ncbi:MAG: TIGR00153 family protein [Desulfobacterales bacterium]